MRYGLRMSVDQAIERIRAFARANQIPKSRLALLAGMRDTVLRNFDKDSWNPTAETLRRLESLIPEEFQPSVEADSIGTQLNCPAAARYKSTRPQQRSGTS